MYLQPVGDDGLGAIFKEIFTDKFVFPHEMNFTAGGESYPSFCLYIVQADMYACLWQYF